MNLPFSRAPTTTSPRNKLIDQAPLRRLCVRAPSVSARAAADVHSAQHSHRESAQFLPLRYSLHLRICLDIECRVESLKCSFAVFGFFGVLSLHVQPRTIYIVGSPPMPRRQIRLHSSQGPAVCQKGGGVDRSLDRFWEARPHGADHAVHLIALKRPSILDDANPPISRTTNQPFPSYF